MHLTLNAVDDAAPVHDIGVRAVQGKKIRIVRHQHAFISPRIVTPSIAQCCACATGHLHWPKKFVGVKPSGVNDDIDFNQSAISRLYAGWGDRNNLFGDQIHIVAGNRFIPVVVYDQPFTKHREFRHTLGHEILTITQMLTDITGKRLS